MKKVNLEIVDATPVQVQDLIAGNFAPRHVHVLEHEGEKGVFIAMPSRKNAEGEYRDVAHPINSDTRNMIQTLILEQYEAMNLGDIDATAPEV